MNEDAFFADGDDAPPGSSGTLSGSRSGRPGINPPSIQVSLTGRLSAARREFVDDVSSHWIADLVVLDVPPPRRERGFDAGRIGQPKAQYG